jgi:hypothetical protein
MHLRRSHFINTMRVYFQIEIRVPTYMHAQSVKNSMSNDTHDSTFNLQLPVNYLLYDTVVVQRCSMCAGSKSLNYLAVIYM